MNWIENGLGQSYADKRLVEYRGVEAFLISINDKKRYFVVSDLIDHSSGKVDPHACAKSVAGVYICFIYDFFSDLGHMQRVGDAVD